MLSQTSVEHKILNVYINIEYPANYFQYEWMRIEACSKWQQKKASEKMVYMTCMLKIFMFTPDFLSLEVISDLRMNHLFN